MLRVNNKLWIISDTHFGHKNIVKFQQRPETHEEIMLSEWIWRVGEKDQILHLGDVFLGKQGNPKRWAAIIGRLPGQKFLIKGNHDEKKNALYHYAGFEVVEPFIHEGFVFSHEPVVDYLIPGDPKATRKRYPPLIEFEDWHTNIHGHSHANDPDEGLLEGKSYINVCVEVMDFKPQQLGNIWKKEKSVAA